MPQVLILANPFSGTGPNAKRVELLQAELKQRGLDSHVVWDRDQRNDALRNTDALQCVIAAGGDGSIADVTNAMRTAERMDVPLATLPVGNENLFAREFGFDGKITAIAEAVAANQSRAIDLGTANGRLFTLMVSAGFDADVVHRVDAWRRSPADGSLHRVNRASYLPRTLSALKNYSYPRVTLEADGQTFDGAHAFVFNIPQYGGNLGIGKRAAPDDGLLDWVVVRHPGLIRLAQFGLLVIVGRHYKSDAIVHGRATHISLKPTKDTPAPAQADGDPLDSTPIDVKILPAALKVICT